MYHGTNRSVLAVLFAAGACTLAPAAPALAVDAASCTAGNESPHAGRQFTLSARTEPITGDYEYAWDLDGDGSFETPKGTESTLRTERATPGSYTFGVQVTDNELPADDPKRQAKGTCTVEVVNDRPVAYFEAHPVEESFPTAYEALRFTYRGSDGEDDLNQVPMTHAIDFDGDGQFEFTAKGTGEVFASFPAGFDRDVTHRLTDAAGASVDTRIRVKAVPNAFGIGAGAVLAPLGLGALPKVTATAPRTVKRKTLLKKGFVAKFHWGPSWGRVVAIPSVRHRGKTATGFPFQGDAGYAPGQQLTIKPLPPQLKPLIKRGAKKLQLRWAARGHDGNEQTGTLVLRIKR